MKKQKKAVSKPLTTSLETLEENYFGKRGTSKRDEYDTELKLEIIESEKLKPIIHTGSEDSKVKIPANGSAQLRIFIESENLPKSEKPSNTFQVKMRIEDINNSSFKINKTLPLRLPDDPSIQ